MEMIILTDPEMHTGILTWLDYKLVLKGAYPFKYFIKIPWYRLSWVLEGFSQNSIRDTMPYAVQKECQLFLSHHVASAIYKSTWHKELL